MIRQYDRAGTGHQPPWRTPSDFPLPVHDDRIGCDPDNNGHAEHEHGYVQHVETLDRGHLQPGIRVKALYFHIKDLLGGLHVLAGEHVHELVEQVPGVIDPFPQLLDLALLLRDVIDILVDGVKTPVDPGYCGYNVL